ncbi:MAG: hypothetical protein KAX37_00860 [Opitutaceae bacterium]|nr:hypothetical protein [Opitutaceae bacterium]
MNRTFVSFFVIAFIWSSPVMANDNAGVFFYGPPPSNAQVASLATGADVTTTIEGSLTNIIVKWPDVSITISIDSAWKREVQLSGIRGWLSQFPAHERNSESVTSFLDRLDRTTTCYGSVISPGYDKAGKVTTLLKRLLGSSGGFFFSHQSFYDASGVRITGLAGAPSALGPI